MTLWGPTHLMLIGGAGMTLDRPGRAAPGGPARAAAAAAHGAARESARIAGCASVALMGGLLIGLSTFQAEFDFGVPQFRARLPARC